ncbi:MAG: LamG-like jellyroll fold domain-containing protein [candidate division KSB1 bacterium]|nr:LamG-like jellyroll fold domain-containing protein [candidate division KSB1 bacterium]
MLNHKVLLAVIVFFYATLLSAPKEDHTVSLWLFDEQCDLYPSQVLVNCSEHNLPLVLGPGGRIVKGKFGNALEPLMHPKVVLPEGQKRFGLVKLDPPPGRTVAPLTWYNAEFAALMTSGETHLRKQVGFQSPAATAMNLGDFDWTVEFWFYPNQNSDSGTVFEIGAGPRGENEKLTRLSLDLKNRSFSFFNPKIQSAVTLPTELTFETWHHVAFVHVADNDKILHFVDGVLLSTANNVTIGKLRPSFAEDYMSIARDGLWEHPLQGKIDELRFSDDVIYTNEFNPPESFSSIYQEGYVADQLEKGPPLLFDDESRDDTPLQLGGRKHLFIDDAFLETVGDVEFTVNPPEKKELVIGNVKGRFRKHLTVIEDEDGLIRIYNSVQDDYMIVHTSRDGVNFKAPNTGTSHGGWDNIVIPERVGGKGTPFIDPNGKGDHKWKYISSYHNRGVYLYTSADGWSWSRRKMALIPFRSGTQSCTFYDDQRQMYVSTHRTGIFHTPGGATQRSTVITQTENLYKPVKYEPLSQMDYWELDKKYRLREPQPWWLDNGPLTPGDFGLEFPHAFDPTGDDPVGMDIYITKAIKYEYAPDTYLSFPITYFHYEKDGPLTRQILYDSTRLRGEGPIETQIAVSRNGLDWKRYYQPAYVPIGKHKGIDVKMAYIAQGMVRRGDELWQHYWAEPHYHGPWVTYDDKRAVFRLVQRLDGFISIDSPYEKEAVIKTKPFVFEGNRLVLNIDTDAVGYTQVGFVDEHDNPIQGFSVDDCVYINGDFIKEKAEWIQNREEFTDVSIGEGESTEILEKVKTTKDVSPLEGKVVKLVFRMRGSKLYSLQFTNK